MNRLRLLAVALAGLLLLGACAGVPTSSAPQTIEQLPLGAQSSDQSSAPTTDAPPREIVQEFLKANGADPGKHASARAFLTTDFRTRWTDTSAMVITDNPSVGTYNSQTHKLTVVAKELGSLDAQGIYTPKTPGDGTGVTVRISFTLALVDGQYRIDRVQAPTSGLILTDSQFTDTYKQRPLYFYDNTEQYLVPDPRYSDIADRGLVSEWLLTQLITGPQPTLEAAVASDTLPAQIDASRITVKLGAPTLVEIPGSSQLDASGRNRLAAQLSETLDDPLAGNKITVTDGGRPVSIPAVHGTQFQPEDFASEVAGATVTTPSLYYVQNGRVYAEDGRPMGGPLGRGSTGLSSVALGSPAGGDSMLAAGIVGAGSGQQLWVGNAANGLKASGVSGALTRPSFAHARREVWVGAGAGLYRLALDPAGNPVGKPVAIPGPVSGGRVTAVRIGPDGVHIAAVVSGQLYIGSIVRGTGEVEVAGWHAISPTQTVIKDVAWLTPLRLFAIGRTSNSTDYDTFDTGVDGTDWTSTTVVGLQQPPDQVTVTIGASAWVSSSQFLWVQSGGQWVSPIGGQTPGMAPVYVE
jgi:hypothetical protein